MSYRYEGNGTFTDEKTEPKKQSASRSDDPWATPPKSQPKSQSKSRAKASDDKPSNSDMGSWIFIAFMFAVAWPIGLIMLISKLSEDGEKAKKAAASKSKSKSSKVKKAAAGVTKSPKDTSGTARVLQIVGICLAAVGGLVGLGLLTDLPYYIEYARWGEIFSDFSVAAAFLASGGGLLWGSWRMKRRMRRFAKYLAVAGDAQSVSITRLAAAAEVSERRVERDLELMIEQGMWGKGAYVDLSAGKLYRSAAVAAEEQERRHAPVTPPQAEQGYAGMLRQIRIANDRIADQELSRKIERLEEIAGRIFRLIENDETKRAKASTFLSYYLPTTQKLLDSYAEFEEAGVSGGNLSEAKRKIERTMDNIVLGFERQLDELYRTDALDIDSDIRVMETMLRRDTARVEDDFRVQTSGGDAEDDFVAPDEGGEEERIATSKVTLVSLEDNSRKVEVVQAVAESSGRPLADCARMVDNLPCVVLETEGDAAPAYALHRRLRELGAKATMSISHTTVTR